MNRCDGAPALVARPRTPRSCIRRQIKQGAFALLLVAASDSSHTIPCRIYLGRELFCERELFRRVALPSNSIRFYRFLINIGLAVHFEGWTGFDCFDPKPASSPRAHDVHEV